MTGFPVGASTMSYMYSHGAPEGMLHMADLGVRTFELVVFPPHIWPPELDENERREIPLRLAERGLTITSLCYPVTDNNIVSPVPEVRRFTIDMYTQVIELAGEWLTTGPQST